MKRRTVKNVFGLCALTVAVGLLPAGLRAQVDEPPERMPSNFTPPHLIMLHPSQMSFFRVPGTSGDYHIGPGDLLQIEVVELGSMDQTVQVSASGKISLAYLGIVDADTTAVELEKRIGRLLVEKKLVKEPEVLVYVISYRSKPIYILGEVDQPGQILMSQELYLMDALLMAGGLDYSSADIAYIHRRALDAPPLSPYQLANAPSTPHTADMEVIEVDLRPMKEGRLLDPNPMMRPNDVVFIPQKKVKFYYIIGEVARVGIFVLPDKGKLKASEALAGAGGTLRTARTSKGIVVRYDSDGKRVEKPVDFAAILDGRKPDIEVQPDDIIFIPGSTVKNWSLGLLGFIPRMAYTATGAIH